jgi:polyvinyl alcohol dehydrogenase (cytochrome)
VPAWPSAGHDISNSRSNPDEHGVGPGNVGSLQQKWSKVLGGEMASTPAVVDGVVYAADLATSTNGVITKGSTIWALTAATGATKWSRTLDSITGGTREHTRGTPAVADGRVIFGTRTTGPGARIVALSSTTGATLWTTQVDTHKNSIITGAPTVTGGVVYIGVSSSEDAAPTCCTFRGSVVALDAATGRVKWRTMTAPAGYSGAAVWASNPAVDPQLGLMYVGTGNNYSVPPGVCRAPNETGCTAPDPTDYVDTLLALRLSDGTVAWSLRSMNSDVWRAMCKTDTTLTCGPDSDFGSSPNLFTATVNGATRKLVGAGQKGGLYWVADAATGALVWQRRVGPGGLGGGIQWGTATDGQRVYAADANSDSRPNTLPNGTTITTGSVAALNVTTGAVAWQLATPNGAQPHSFVSTANGVVYVGTDLPASGPNMYALDAATGRQLWSYAAGGRVRGGASVVGSVVYWGGGSTLRAFSLPAAAARPDLVVTSSGTTPTSPTAGAATKFVATVKNVGTAATPAGTIVGVLFRVDGVGTAFSDTWTASIAPGASVTLTTNGGPKAPGGAWTATAGVHSVVAHVDDVNRIAESHEGNNTLSSTLSVVAASSRPDLVVTALGSSPAAPTPGAATRFTATVKNQGSAPTPAGTVVGVLFRVDGAATSWSDTYTTAIPPGASVTLTTNGGTANGPGGVWTATVGAHSVSAQVDDINRIAESDDTNNTRAMTLTVS